jgi:hypothetical protein
MNKIDNLKFFILYSSDIVAGMDHVKIIHLD